MGPRCGVLCGDACRGDLQSLGLTTRLNGEVVQRASTGLMVFSCAHLVAQVSAGTTLVPGTVLLTGMPAGVGMASDPPRFLREDDTVEVEIAGLGAIRNRVRTPFYGAAAPVAG